MIVTIVIYIIVIIVIMLFEFIPNIKLTLKPKIPFKMLHQPQLFLDYLDQDVPRFFFR